MTGRALLLSMALSALGQAQGVAPPRIQNDIAACVQVLPGEPRTELNLLLLPARLTVRRSIGVCGCASGGIRYRAYETYQGKPREMNTGVLNSIPRTGKSADVLLVLSPDSLIHRTPPYRVDFTCDE